MYADESFDFDTAGAPNNGRIIGGTPAQIQEHPYMVSVELDEKHFCGGFIYNEYHVVTAASCVAEYVNHLLRYGWQISDIYVKQKFRYKDTPEELSVTVGASSLVFPDPFEERIFAAKVTVYDEFDATTKLHDIAVIRVLLSLFFYVEREVYETLFWTVGKTNSSTWNGPTYHLPRSGPRHPRRHSGRIWCNKGRRLVNSSNDEIDSIP